MADRPAHAPSDGPMHQRSFTMILNRDHWTTLLCYTIHPIVSCPGAWVGGWVGGGGIKHSHFRILQPALGAPGLEESLAGTSGTPFRCGHTDILGPVEGIGGW